MSEQASTRHWIMLGLLLIVIGIEGLRTSRVDAQRDDDAVILARICVSEAGWADSDDCAAIHAVIAGIAEREGMSWRSAARAASPRLAACTVSRRWLCGLDERGDEPAHWPSTASWSRYRDDWLSALRRARQIMSGEHAHRCAEAPRTWGSVEDFARARRAGRRMRVIDCGDTRNRFAVFGGTR